jgi:hypothetical protein
MQAASELGRPVSLSVAENASFGSGSNCSRGGGDRLFARDRGRSLIACNLRPTEGPFQLRGFIGIKI